MRLHLRLYDSQPQSCKSVQTFKKNVFRGRRQHASNPARDDVHVTCWMTGALLSPTKLVSMPRPASLQRHLFESERSSVFGATTASNHAQAHFSLCHSVSLL